MTYEEAMIQISFIKNFGYPQDIAMLSKEVNGEEYKALNMAIEALEKAEKDKWHDLRKNPNDLPIYEKPYWCVIETMGKTIYEPKINKEYRVLVRCQILNLKEFVIAWREIDPFEEEA